MYIAIAGLIQGSYLCSLLKGVVLKVVAISGEVIISVVKMQGRGRTC